MSINAEKLKALQLTIDKLEKTYGKGTVMKLSDNKVQDIPAISTGSLGLDMALGIGGIPRGRVIEIYGPESSGKTTLTLHCIAEAQKAGGMAAFIDAEHAFDKNYAEKLGIDTENLLISQPDNGEQALEIAEHLIRSGAIDIIVIDSVAALVPKGELEGEMGESKMGLQARLMSQALRKLTGAINKTGCSCIFINQLRDKIGVMFGSPETTTGGNALKFYASVRLDIRRVGQIKEGADNILGNRTRVKVVKNKVAPPFKVVEFDIMYGQGISKVGEIIDLGVEFEIIKKAGSWFSYNGEKLGQGRDSVKNLLLDNPELMDELEVKIKAASGLLPTQPTIDLFEWMTKDQAVRIASTGSIRAARVAGTIPATTPIMEDTPKPKSTLLKERMSSKLPNWTKLKANTSKMPVPPPIRLRQMASKRN